MNRDVTPVVETLTVVRWLHVWGCWAKCPRCGSRFRGDKLPDADLDPRCPMCREQLLAPAIKLMEETQP